MSLCGRIDIVGRRERPTFRSEYESMIAEMVVSVSKEDIEGHATIEFMQVLLNICAISHDKIYDVKIAIARAGTTSIV